MELEAFGTHRGPGEMCKHKLGNSRLHHRLRKANPERRALPFLEADVVWWVWSFHLPSLTCSFEFA